MKVDQHVSGIKKYAPSFEYTKQMAKERFGIATNSVDSYETKMLKDKIHHIKHTLHDIKIAGQDYIDHMAILAEKGAIFSDALSSIGRESLPDSALGVTISMVGDMVKNQAVSTKASSMSTSSQVVSPLVKIYDEELQVILALKNDQERVRVQHEAQQAKLKDYQKKGSKKLRYIEAETLLVKESYDKITSELIYRCDALINQMESTLLPSMQAYISFQAAFFTNLSEQWKRMEKNMVYNAISARQERDGAGEDDPLAAECSTRARSQSTPPLAGGGASM